VPARRLSSIGGITIDARQQSGAMDLVVGVAEMDEGPAERLAEEVAAPGGVGRGQFEIVEDIIGHGETPNVRGLF
jgi:hypothetical protein